MSRLDNAKSRAVINTTLRSEYGFDMVALLNSIDDKLSGISTGNSTGDSTGGRLLVETLGVPTVARQLTAGATSSNTILTTTCRRISILPIGGAIRFAVGVDDETTASATTSHYIKDGERLDFSVPGNSWIAIIRVGSSDVPVEITELT
jgi:hypothetical protein